MSCSMVLHGAPGPNRAAGPHLFVVVGPSLVMPFHHELIQPLYASRRGVLLGCFCKMVCSMLMGMADGHGGADDDDDNDDCED